MPYQRVLLGERLLRTLLSLAARPPKYQQLDKTYSHCRVWCRALGVIVLLLFDRDITILIFTMLRLLTVI